MHQTYKVISANIGAKSFIQDFPTNDLAGLFDALKRWSLDSRLYSPEKQLLLTQFKGMAWGHCVKQYDSARKKRVWVATKPIYPDFPDAVEYCGNFLENSFGFHIVTADQDLISALDNAIAANLARQYVLNIDSRVSSISFLPKISTARI